MKKPHEQDWKVRSTNQGFVVDEEGGEAVALVYYPSGDYARAIVEAEAVGEARANLIAASPSMARALLSIHSVPADDHGEVVLAGEFVDMLGDLLRKAGVL